MHLELLTALISGYIWYLVAKKMKKTKTTKLKKDENIYELYLEEYLTLNYEKRRQKLYTFKTYVKSRQDGWAHKQIEDWIES